MRTYINRANGLVAGLAAGVTALTGMAVPAAAAETRADKPPKVTIELKHYGGTGCTKNDTVVSADPDVVTMLFAKFVASAKNGGTDKKTCEVTFALKYDAGWIYTVVNSDYRGHNMISTGSETSHRSTYYYEGDSYQSVAASKWTQATDGDTFAYRDSQSRLVWSTCGAKQYLFTQQLIEAKAAKTGNAQISMDSIDTSVRSSAKFNLEWKRC
jgi:hypothetical protein